MSGIVSGTGKGIAAVACLLLAGCALMGGGGPPPKARGAKVAPPENWREIDRADSDRAYRLPTGSIALLNSACGRESRASLEVLTRQLLFGSRQVKLLERRPFETPGGEGLLSSVSTVQDGTPMRLVLIVLRKEGCVFDFSLLGSKEFTSQELDLFFLFVRSLRYGKD